jgi:hypothetical protein
LTGVDERAHGQFDVTFDLLLTARQKPQVGHWVCPARRPSSRWRGQCRRDPESRRQPAVARSVPRRVGRAEGEGLQSLGGASAFGSSRCLGPALASHGHLPRSRVANHSPPEAGLARDPQWRSGPTAMCRRYLPAEGPGADSWTGAHVQPVLTRRMRPGRHAVDPAEGIATGDAAPACPLEGAYGPDNDRCHRGCQKSKPSGVDL